MGVVWQGTHVGQGVPVAVKVLTLEGSRDPLYLASLRNEVRGVAGLDHSAIVRIFDQGVLPDTVHMSTGGDLSPGSPYLVMELLEGGTLVPLCGRMGWAQVWRVLAQILDGLAHAHARGVIHRDIKPSNILLRRQGAGVTLVDFGLARAGDRERGGSSFLDVGTPGYMAPEQILGKKVDEAADIYSIGVIMYEMVTGIPPYSRGDHMSVMYQHVQGKAKTCQEVNPGIPDDYAAVIGKSMSVDKSKRYQTMEELMDALTDIQI